MLRLLLFAVVAHMILTGCSRRVGDGPNTVLLVPGVAGDGAWYSGVKRGLLRHDSQRTIETFSWGAPLPLFMLNFSNAGMHEKAEARLAGRLNLLSERGPFDIVAHSAGCGVVLGALSKCDEPVPVRNVILLAPSVSPSYDLRPSLSRVSGTIHVFHSDRDRLFLSWRTSRFGTYDNIKTQAAGNRGFDVNQLDPSLAAKLVQHPYDPAWKRLGNDGSHDGPLATKFIEQIVAPLLDPAPARPAQSSAVNQR